MREIRWKWLQERGFDLDPEQRQYMQSLWSREIQAIFCEAKAGTGKTTLAVLAGAYLVEAGEFDRILYIRNTVALRDMGFLPGNQGEKEAPYMAPFIEALDKVKAGTYEAWSRGGIKGEQPKAVALSTAFTRGITWERSFIIIDEAQNFDLDELQAVYTRATDTCKVVTVGSLRQNDNRKQRKIYGYTPFEVYTIHFSMSDRVALHRLSVNYRGWLSDHADDVQDTVEILRREGADVLADRRNGGGK